MMQFRLRTLLIVVTALSVPMAWIAYAKQNVAHHRREAATIVHAINARKYMPPEFAWDGIARHATEGILKQEELVDGGLMVWHPDSGLRLAIHRDERDDWDRAVSHHKAALLYDQAILRPWVCFSSAK